MNHKVLTAIGTALAIGSIASAQTADDLVKQGRDFLAATNMFAANLSFSNAVVKSPNHPVANVLHAASQLLAWPDQPIGSNFLTALQFPAAGRNIYKWTSQVPSDSRGLPLVSETLNARDITDILRTNLAPGFIAAEACLAKVTDINFQLVLSARETRTVEVTLDFGDLQILRAMLKAAECLSYNFYSWNLDARLAAIRTLYTNEQLSLERLLMDYPHLLQYSSTNDLVSAKSAFQAGVARYLEGSQRIRARGAKVVNYLFNFDPSDASGEEKFRQTLIDLNSSLAGAVPLAVADSYRVCLAPFFSGRNPVRAWLPAVRGNNFVLGSLPDPTFGGLVEGLDPDQIEDTLAQYLGTIPSIQPLVRLPDQKLRVSLNVQRGNGYMVQSTTNLLQWTDLTAFIAPSNHISFEISEGLNLPRLFYRLSERK